jgi:putative transcriptional regulator
MRKFFGRAGPHGYAASNAVAKVAQRFYTPRPMPRESPRTAHLCNNLQQYRLQRTLTQQELAVRVGVNRHTIVNIEGNRSLPSILLAYRLAQALNVPVTDLFHP